MLSLPLTFLPACSQAASLSPSSITFQLTLLEHYTLSKSVTCHISFSYLQIPVLLSYSSRLLLHQSLESAKGQFIFMNVCIKHDLPKHSLFLVRLTKQNIFSACGPSHFEDKTRQKELGRCHRSKGWNVFTHQAFSYDRSNVGK